MTFWQRFHKQVELARNYERRAKLVNLRAPAQICKMDRQMFVDASKDLKVPAWHLAAVANVESGGRSYDSFGRLKILFEPHIFHKVTKGAHKGLTMPVDWNGQVIDAEVSYRSWRRLTTAQANDDSYFHIYKLDNLARWDLLARLYEVDERALEAASYGAYQLLGRNWFSLGYKSAFDMVESLYDGERANISGVIRFIRVNRILAALRSGDWLKFAKLYNGRGAARSYAVRLRDAANAARQAMGLM